MKKLITIQILENPQKQFGSIGSYRENLKVDDIDDKDAILALVTEAYRKADQINTPIAIFGVTNTEGDHLYHGTIHSDGKKINLLACSHK